MDVPAGGAMTRRAPAIMALDDHAKACPRCLAAAQAGLPPFAMCQRGRVLFRFAKREQARFRRAS